MSAQAVIDIVFLLRAVDNRGGKLDDAVMVVGLKRP
jgi:hypothetical protein